MNRDEIRANQTIAVEKHYVLARGLENRAISDFSSTEAAVLVPDVEKRDAEPRFPLRNQRCGRRRRAIVRYEHLEVSVLLRSERTKYRVKGVFAVEGGDDDGDQRVHRSRPFSHAFM